MAVASSPFDLVHIFDALKELTLEQTKTLFFNITGDLPPELSMTLRNFGKGLVIAHWLDSDADASWEKICSGLKQMKLNVLAQKIDSKYCTPPRVPPSTTDSLSTDSTACESHQPSETIPCGASDQMPTTTGRVTENLNSQHTQTVSVEQPTDPTPVTVMEVKKAIEMLEDNFAMIYSHMRRLLCKKESQDPEFLDEFRDYLLFLPLSKRIRHAKFFQDNEYEIIEARNIRKLLAILGRYCSHSNYDIVFRIINRFCDAALKKRMSEYCIAFEKFETSTTVDVYCVATSAGMELLDEFTKMTAQIKKPTSICTIHEVRKLKEHLAEKSHLHSYSVYIDSIAES